MKVNYHKNGRFLSIAKSRALPNGRHLLPILILSVVVTSLVMGARYIGLLQGWELENFDQLQRLRPDEGPEPRLLVIGITEDDFHDFHLPGHKGENDYPLSDASLGLVVNKIEELKPQGIGLDIASYLAPEKDLGTRVHNKEDFFDICGPLRLEDKGDEAPTPSGVSPERQAFHGVVEDRYSISRRYLLAMNPPSGSLCNARYALSAQLAFHYLKAKGIFPKYTQDGDLQLGQVVFKRLQSHTGAYQAANMQGHQILINYRTFQHSPVNIVQQISLKDVLAGRLQPKDVKDRIVLIGVIATSIHDYTFTPYSQPISGIVLQAQMSSQILSAVLAHRPLLWFWPWWGDFLWVWAWSFAGGVLAWKFRSQWVLSLAVVVSGACLYGLCFGFLIQSGAWIPMVPSALALAGTSSSVAMLRSKFKMPA